MIKNAIFDLGGVVLGRDFKRLGEVLGNTFAFISADESFPEYWSEFDRGTYTREEVTRMLAKDYNLTLEDAHEQVQRLLELLQPIPETVALIEELKARGIRCYVLSNMSKEFYAELLKFPVFELFDGAVVSFEERINKPDRGIYEALLSRYNLVPSESIFADDKIANTEAASLLGLHTVTYNCNGDGPERVREIIWRENGW
ncbi:MAG: HAD family phosphatase [Tidjanibacter sp.]|nr:HAD family phosphatase [Tidjanibacter sp.]